MLVRVTILPAPRGWVAKVFREHVQIHPPRPYRICVIDRAPVCVCVCVCMYAQTCTRMHAYAHPAPLCPSHLSTPFNPPTQHHTTALLLSITPLLPTVLHFTPLVPGPGAGFVINKLIVKALPVHEFLPAAIYGVHLYIRMFGITLALIQALHSYDRCAIDSSKLGIAACMSILRIAPILSV